MGAKIYCGTCFVDLDGTVLRHGTQELLPGALAELRRLRYEGWMIVFTTRRGEEFSNHPVYARGPTEKALRGQQVPYDHIIFNAASPRIVIDDHRGQHIYRETNDPVLPGEFTNND